MGMAISALADATTLGDDDVFEIEQAGVSKKATALLLSNRLSVSGTTPLELDGDILPQSGDVIFYDGSNYVTYKNPDIGPPPQYISKAARHWRVINAAAYTTTAVASSYEITFTGGSPTGRIYLKASDYFSVGSPVRTVIAGTTYYGICTAVTDTLLTIAGGILPLATAITSLSVGTPDMVKSLTLVHTGVSNWSGFSIIYYGCVHNWNGPVGYLCHLSAASMGSAIAAGFDVGFGGSIVNTNEIVLTYGTPTTYGAFLDLPPGTIINSECSIFDGQDINLYGNFLGSADTLYLIVCMTFVVP